MSTESLICRVWMQLLQNDNTIVNSNFFYYKEKIVNIIEKLLSHKLGSKTKIMVLCNLCNLNKKIVILYSKFN